MNCLRLLLISCKRGKQLNKPSSSFCSIGLKATKKKKITNEKTRENKTYFNFIYYFLCTCIQIYVCVCICRYICVVYMWLDVSLGETYKARDTKKVCMYACVCVCVCVCLCVRRREMERRSDRETISLICNSILK